MAADSIAHSPQKGRNSILNNAKLEITRIKDKSGHQMKRMNQRRDQDYERLNTRSETEDLKFTRMITKV